MFRNSFKKKIKGIFEDWNMETRDVLRYDQRTFPLKSFRILIVDFKNFRDVDFRKPFLSVFTPRERKALWKELQKRIRNMDDPVARSEINQEFKIDRAN